MERFMKRDIVVIPFPFTNLISVDKRPALVLIDQIGEDIVLCQITSKSRPSFPEISIKETDFILGKLKVKSFVKLTRLITIHYSKINYKLGSIKTEKMNEITEKLCELLKR